MKLYFYILEKPYEGSPHVKISECDVEEKPKTYKPVDKFPSGYYGCYVKKEDIGHLIGYSDDVVVLTKKDNFLAKEIFENHFKKSIESKERELKNILNLMNAVRELED